METSLFLAKVIGSFGALTTLAIMWHYKFYLQMEANVAKNQTTIYLSGFVFLLLGILISVSHQVWTLDWRVIITIIGWLTLVKGLMRILLPNTISYLLEKKQTERRFIYGEATLFLLCIYLLYQGFIAG